MARRRKTISLDNLPEDQEVSDTLETDDSLFVEGELEDSSDVEVVEEVVEEAPLEEIVKEVIEPTSTEPTLQLPEEVEPELKEISPEEKPSPSPKTKEKRPLKPKAKRKTPKNQLKFVR